VTAEQPTDGNPASTRLPGTNIELLTDELPCGKFKAVLFDFDGTLSLIRAGWQDVMIPMLTDILTQYRRDGETREDIHLLVKEFVTDTTGKQTIYQMIGLCEEIKKRGGQPKAPLEYKHQYLQLLWDKIKERVASLENGDTDPEQMLVPGSRQLLEAFQSRGLVMYVASGTDRPYVLREVRALQLQDFFGDRLYGAIDNYKEFSKELLINDILTTNNLSGNQLLCFGDGYVEIESTKRAGGTAVGVASTETNIGELNQWKRQRLIAAGADLIVPDLRDYNSLIAYLCGDV